MNETEKKGNGGDKGISLLITLDPSGNVNVRGPLAQKVLLYGMLERAKDVIRDFKPKQEQIIRADPSALKILGAGKPS